MKHSVYIPYILISACIIVAVNYFIPYFLFFWMNDLEFIDQENPMGVVNALVSIPVFIYSLLELLKSLKEREQAQGAMFVFIVRIQGFIFIFNFIFASSLLAYKFYSTSFGIYWFLFEFFSIIFVLAITSMFIYVLSIIFLTLTSGLIVLSGIRENKQLNRGQLLK